MQTDCEGFASLSQSSEKCYGGLSQHEVRINSQHGLRELPNPECNRYDKTLEFVALWGNNDFSLMQLSHRWSIID